ncbi:hypothetical protein GIB67_042391 [Kingdonia uniflora]|uniref:Uncharacterized protein n=1 Tax=Kingdonia uniflora TaxID=39325 RepID=A0A7J7M859_9MAGN|nr:hypothetical protein GIB67_042391 [Kingdonia uniflora]
MVPVYQVAKNLDIMKLVSSSYYELQNIKRGMELAYQKGLGSIIVATSSKSLPKYMKNAKEASWERYHLTIAAIQASFVMGWVFDDHFSSLVLSSEYHEKLRSIEGIVKSLSSEARLCCSVTDVVENLVSGI